MAQVLAQCESVASHCSMPSLWGKVSDSFQTRGNTSCDVPNMRSAISGGMLSSDYTHYNGSVKGEHTESTRSMGDDCDCNNYYMGHCGYSGWIRF